MKRERTHRDRYYAVRSDGSEVSWATASAPGLPHDLAHLVVESVLGLGRGFWRLVEAGMEPDRTRAVAEHTAGAADGLDDLMVAERVVSAVFGPMPLEETRVADADVERMRALGADLAGRWADTAPGRGLDLVWPLAEAGP